MFLVGGRGGGGGGFLSRFSVKHFLKYLYLNNTLLIREVLLGQQQITNDIKSSVFSRKERAAISYYPFSLRHKETA